MTLPFYPKRELPRRVREALGQLDPADDIRTTAQIVELVDELDVAPVWSALETLRDQGFVEFVTKRKARADSTWRLTALSRRAPTSIRFTKRQAAALGVVEKLGGTATAAEAGHLVSKHLQRLRAMGVLTIQPDSRPWRYVLPALALLVLAMPAMAHDQYLGWTHDRKGLSCCTGVGHSAHGDCQPVKLCNGDTGFLEPGTGRCIPIASDAITTPLPTMTDEPHACWRGGGAIQYCISLGSRG